MIYQKKKIKYIKSFMVFSHILTKVSVYLLLRWNFSQFQIYKNTDNFYIKLKFKDVFGLQRISH